jgi:uncharacterized protein DUF4388
MESGRTTVTKMASSRPSAALSGLLEDVSVPDLLELLQSSRKNGVLAVSADGHEGRIYLRGGNIRYAAIDGEPTPGPRKSLCRILAWRDGSFELERPDGGDFPDELEDSTEALLMEALRQLDEQRELEKSLPPATSSLTPTWRLSSPLHDLSPEQLDVLQLAMCYRTVDAILDRSALSDRDTCEALVELIGHGYLQVH